MYCFISMLVKFPGLVTDIRLVSGWITSVSLSIPRHNVKLVIVLQGGADSRMPTVTLA